MSKFFLDRSLGGKVVPRLLRERNWDVVTMAEHYGSIRAQTLDDVTWIREMSHDGFVLLTADSRITSNLIERQALLDASAIVFLIPSGALTGPQMGARFDRHKLGIEARVSEGGPAGYAIYEALISRVVP